MGSLTNGISVFEGFTLIPKNILTELELDKLELHSRELIPPDRTLMRSSDISGKVLMPKYKISKEEFIETVKEVDEVVLGVDFAEGLRVYIRLPLWKSGYSQLLTTFSCQPA